MFDIDWHKVLDQFRYNPKDPLLFNSAFFLLFFGVFLLFFMIVHKRKLTRIVVFTIFSLYFFYKCCGWYVSFILIAAVVDYILSNAIWRTPSKGKKRALLAFSVTINLGLLAFFKYTDLFITTMNELNSGHIQPLHLIIPVGISFYTFENLSYTIDVYRGHFKPVTNFMDYLFFLSFFPKLVMGPIVRASDFIPQIRQDSHVSREDVSEGLFLILSGLFRKVIISDYLYVNFVQYIFNDPSKHSGVECLFGVYGYAFVIYCDFSGYSDMAIGMAKWMGFRIPPNFETPYQSASITEFWRRWHISLSSWLRDYLYITLGGNRNGSIGTWLFPGIFFVAGGFVCWHLYTAFAITWPFIVLAAVLLIFTIPPLLARSKKDLFTNFNLFTTMLLGGLWHGASWNFLIWGALHGTALGIDKMRIMIADKLKMRGNLFWRIIGVLITFHFVCFCWIFFKADSFSEASDILAQIFYNFAPKTFMPMVQGYSTVFIVLALAFVLHFLPRIMRDRTQFIMSRMSLLGRALLLMGMIWLVIQVKQSEQVLPIYLQF